jgi:hypothetical protein
MPNARNIKPAALTDHRFYKKDPLLFFLYFVGLPMIADREGRLEDELQAIQLTAMPLYPECNLKELLYTLECMKAIDRYQIGEKKIIQINKWLDLQRPASLERDSNLPDKKGMLRVWTRNKKHIVAGDFVLIPYGSDAGQIDIAYVPKAYPSDTLTSESGLPNTDSEIQTIDDQKGVPVDNLTSAVCRLFLKNEIHYFKADNAAFNALLLDVNDFGCWKLGVETAVSQKAPEHPSANYVMGIVRNKWRERGEKSNGNVYPFGESPEHNTERDLHRRAALLGIVQGHDHLPAFRQRIELLEGLKEAIAERVPKVC